MGCQSVAFLLFSLILDAFAVIKNHQIINLPNLTDTIQFKQFAGHIELKGNEKYVFYSTFWIREFQSRCV